jgi:hypothetical protein
MPINGLLRRIDVNTYVASTQVPTKLPTIKYGRDLLLYLTGSITSTATTPSVNVDSPLSLIKAIDLVGASGDSSRNGSLHRMTGFDMYALNGFETGSLGYLRRNGNKASTAYTFEAFLVIPFTMFPADSLNLLPMSQPTFNNLELDVTWGAPTDMDSGTGTAASFGTTPTLTIYQLTRETPPTATPSLFKTVSKSLSPLTASQDNDYDLKTGLPIESILVRITDNSVRSDSYVTNVNLIESDTIYHVASVPWKVLQYYNRYRARNGQIGGGFGLGSPFVEFADESPGSAGAFTNAILKDTFLPQSVNGARPFLPGYAYINLIDYEGTAIDTSVMSSFKLRLTCGTSGGGTPVGTAILRQKIG